MIKYGLYTQEEIIIGALEDAIEELEKHIDNLKAVGIEPNQYDLDLLNVRKAVLKDLQET